MVKRDYQNNGDKVDTISMRIAYGQALAALGAEYPDLVVLDADVSASTQSHFFASAFPERFFNLGVAEPGMIDVAVGLALGGKIPVANTFAFLIALRCAEQVRSHLSYGGANVKLAAGYSGLSDSFDGPTHHSINDLAVMRSMPGLTLVVPADAVEMEKLLPQVIKREGPVYLRLSRAEAPVIFEDNYGPEIGKGVVLREGTDVTLVNCGILLNRCLQAAGRLAESGVKARVINLHTLKPLDTALLAMAAQETGTVVTVEEHSIIGGLGAAVAEALGESCPVPVERVGLRDTFAETGPYDDLLDTYGMSVDHIVAAADRAIQRKQAGCR
jgi:transketolase